MIFDKMIGQEQAKDLLQFYLEAKDKLGIFPNMLMLAPKGTGKTYLAELLGEALEKPFIKINAASIKSFDSLVHKVFEKFEGEEYTLFIDEIHKLKKGSSTIDGLLTVLDTKSSHVTELTHEDRKIIFDFRKFTFLASTTEKQLVFEPFLDRLQHITLVAYSPEEIGKIIRFHTPDLFLTQDAVDFLLPYCRGNARQAWHIAQNLIKFAAVNDLKTVDKDAAVAFTDKLHMLEFGVTLEEFRVLRLIAEETKGVTLTTLTSRTDYTKGSQQDIEKFLLRLGLITNENSLRKVTQKGKDYITRNLKYATPKRGSQSAQS